MHHIRASRDDDATRILSIINTAAVAYRGVIPPDCWHEPYMSAAELSREMTEGVTFWVCEIDGEIAGVMGMQAVHDVDLIRHAYVLPQHQRSGIGAALLEHLRGRSTRRMLVGTWEAATWAIAFYRRHSFELVDATTKLAMLKTYWSIPQRQVETSVVLASRVPRREPG
jgi:N-acetylglutamate synthase-like GNAT family acetyltransferase